MKNIKIVPINNYCVLKKIVNKNSKKIILPEKNKDIKNIGKVVFVKKNNKIKKGDILVYSKYSENRMNIFNKKFIFVKFKNIIGILKNVL
ncbi:co-chaperone GroES family protein [Candidatus Vidania fulgoroideorum]